MRVKIGEKIYDSALEPIMLILSACEKDQIGNMSPQDTKYCSYPDDYENIVEFMTANNDITK